MNEIKEKSPQTESMSSEQIRENDRAEFKGTDLPNMRDSVEPSESLFSDSSDAFDEIFKRYGLMADSPKETDKSQSDISSEKDYSQYLEKGQDGRYYDKETGRAYDSVEDWIKAQETLAKRYEGTAEYFKTKADKEWARFKNAENNGESDAEKWDHYRKSQEYYSKAKECTEKAAEIRARLNDISRETSEDNNTSDIRESAESNDLVNTIIDSLQEANVSYRPIRLFKGERTTDEIVARLSGGDLTEGSCSSLALAYAGNKAGYDVLDFRDGDSRAFFSKRDTIQKIASLPGVKSTVLNGTNDIASANQLLDSLTPGKEYYLATGSHASIVRRNGDTFEYLELQHPSGGNGWHKLDNNTLMTRFGCRSLRLNSNFLIDLDSLSNSHEFLSILGYINTAEEEQRKGGAGDVR